MSMQTTLGELKRDGIAVLSVREELRKNLIARLTSGERILPGIIGYDQTVMPELEKYVPRSDQLLSHARTGAVAEGEAFRLPPS